MKHSTRGAFEILMKNKLRSILSAAALMAALAFTIKTLLHPSIGHINLLFSPHEHVLLVNPGLDSNAGEFAWTESIRAAIPLIRAEVAAVEARGQGKLMQPHENFLSKAFAGGQNVAESVTDARTEEDEPTWDWGMIRAGTVDTCLAAHLPQTMVALENALAVTGGAISAPLHLHTAFLSRLGVGKVLAPHCGETRGLWRLIIALDGPTVGPIARQSVLQDHSACTHRFAKPCPEEYSDVDYQLEHSLQVKTVEYGVGDVLLFNDFCCHWVSYIGNQSRLALIINVDRPDVPAWRLRLLGWISRVFMNFRGHAIRRASEQACAYLT